MSDSAPAAAARPAASLAIRLLAAVGLIALIALIISALVAIVAIFSFSNHRNPPAEVAVQEKTAPALAVQQVEAVHGTGFVAITIGVGDGNGASGYSSRPDPDQRNVVLLDKATGASRRLLPNNSRRIENMTFFPAATDAEPTRSDVDPSIGTSADGVPKDKMPPMAYYVLLVRQNGSDRKDVLIGNLAGGSQAFLLTNIDGIDRMWMLAPDRLAVLLREGKRLQYRIIEVPTLQTLLSRVVEIG